MTDKMERQLIRGALKSLLLSINALEGLERDAIAEYVREALMFFKNDLERRKEYQDNATLAKLDAVFTAAGWDDQGFRWTTEKDSDHGVPEIWVVYFKDQHHTTWEI